MRQNRKQYLATLPKMNNKTRLKAIQLYKQIKQKCTEINRTQKKRGGNDDADIAMLTLGSLLVALIAILFFWYVFPLIPLAITFGHAAWSPW